MSGLRDIYGLACPACGNQSWLIVELVTLADLTSEGTEPFGDQYWGDASACRCPSCNHHATVADFAADDEPVSNDNHCSRKDD